MSNASNIKWTNVSVKALAGENDPIAVVKKESRRLVQSAKEKGWKGPPFNPIEIAKILNVTLVANSGISDARLLFVNHRKIIEFNPQQTRERVRFSIAHELAHLLFPDWHEQIRNRGGTEGETDDWQLEMLCNLAASEFVLPIGSLPAAFEISPIEELMKQCRLYDVSVEAFLIRLAKIATKPIGVFVASPHTTDGNGKKYKIDYFVGSAVAPHTKLVGVTIPTNSVVYNCTAIGFTDSKLERWIENSSTQIECVGIPGYPRSLYPRVAGLIRFEFSRSDRHPVKIVHGNVFDPRGSGHKIICQLVNDRATKWGGGIARKASSLYPDAEMSFTNIFHSLPKEQRLGEVIFSECSESLTIASLIAQKGFGASEYPRIRYSALERCLKVVAKFALETNSSIHMPRIGTGAAKADWDTVLEMVEDTMVRSGIAVTIYEQPPKRQQLELF